MTRYQPLWQQSGSYQASADRAALAAIAPIGECLSGGLPATVTNTMNVSVPAGSVIVALNTPTPQCQLCTWDAPEVVTLAAAPPSGQSRVDLIIVQVRDNALDSGGNNDFIITAVTGVGAASPAWPLPLPNNSFLLATVIVQGASANLNSAVLADRRLGQWLPITFAASWAQYAGFATCQYRVDGKGKGWMKGMAQYSGGNFTTGSVGTIPAQMGTAYNLNERFTVASAQTGTLTGAPFITMASPGVGQPCSLNLNTTSGTTSNPFTPLEMGGWQSAGPWPLWA